MAEVTVRDLGRTMASLRMTATRVTVGPRRRSTRLSQSRSRASRRSTLWTGSASSHLAVALPALVIRPSRWSFSALFRRPGVRPQELARLWARGKRAARPTRRSWKGRFGWANLWGLLERMPLPAARVVHSVYRRV